LATRIQPTASSLFTFKPNRAFPLLLAEIFGGREAERKKMDEKEKLKLLEFFLKIMNIITPHLNIQQ
jgi:hypothetical protein